MQIRDLDDRLLGQRGLLAVSSMLALLALAGGITAAARSQVAAAVFAFLIAAWAGFWAVRRWWSLRA